MKKLTFTAATLIAVSALVSSMPANAENGQGGPLSQNGQCFNYSAGQSKDGRFGYWGACAQKASAAVPTSTQTQRRQRRSATR
jgi:hypothetical protein